MSPHPRLYLLSLFLGCFSFLNAQNAVNNYSFETNSGCPTGPCQYQRAIGWNNVNGVVGCTSAGSPDYFHTCGSGFSRLPYNGYLTCNPVTGNAVMGFLTWSGSLSPNFREYVSQPLATPLTAGQTYDVSFWLCNAYTPYYGGGSNNIGLDFHTSPHSQASGAVIYTTPEIEINSVYFSNAWQQFTFQFTPTQNFSYITFGNFHDDASTTAVLYDAGAAYFRCYYFLDDVMITPAVSLPVQLSGPEVNAFGDGAMLSWEAQEEAGMERYEVQRSAWPNHGFEDLGVTEVTDDGKNGHSYRFPDRKLPGPGTWYYRLRMVGQDGKAQFSELATFEFEPDHSGIVRVLPSPVQRGSEALVQAWFHGAGMYRLSVTDVQGRELWYDEGTAYEGQMDIAVPTADFAAGMYLLRLESEGRVSTSRLVVGE